jgi:hypothetical protein
MVIGRALLIEQRIDLRSRKTICATVREHTGYSARLAGGHTRVTDALCYSEISQDDAGCPMPGSHQDILGLDIAMYDSVVVQVLNSLE